MKEKVCVSAYDNTKSEDINQFPYKCFVFEHDTTCQDVDW